MLKRRDDGEVSEGSAERDAKENDAGREHQVSRSYLTLQVLTNVKFFIAFVFFVQFHSCLFQQQNLLQDYLRITTYQRAILVNEADFRGKVTAHMVT